jgi:hypothetical protein
MVTVPKPVQDAGYTAVGVGVLALQQFHLRRRAIKERVETVVGEVRTVAEPVARSVGLDKLAAPVCAVISTGFSTGRAFVDAALGNNGNGNGSAPPPG